MKLEPTVNYKKIAIATPIPAMPTRRFLNSLPASCDWLVADDSNGRLKLPERKNIFVYDYKSQKKILGKFYNEFIPFHKSSSCRNFINYLAYKRGYDIVIALDYDCIPPKNFIKNHCEAFSASQLLGVKTPSGWINPLENSEWFSRGFPYGKRNNYQKGKIQGARGRNVVVNMGLWKSVVDINAIDKVLRKPPKKFRLSRPHTAALGYLPLCGMNTAFVREIIPAYFFFPNFKIGNWEVSRHDDIWGGYILQKLIEIREDIITYGKPIVFHEKESDQRRALYHEHYVSILEHYFYEMIDGAAENVKKDSYPAMFAHFADNFERELNKRRYKMPKSYFQGLKCLSGPVKLWVKLFQKI